MMLWEASSITLTQNKSKIYLITEYNEELIIHYNEERSILDLETMSNFSQDNINFN